jgi:lysophospholipase L1-like esterase
MNEKWIASWAGSGHGPYPLGSAVAQPDLTRVFPSAESGARDQTFRLIVRPDLWGRQTRLRFSNAFGNRPVTLDGIFVGVQMGSAAVLPGSNRPVRFGGKAGVTIPAGELAWSDPVDLPYLPRPDSLELSAHRMAVSFHVAGESGPMTWHAKAMQTSYVTGPGAGSKGHLEDEASFPFTTTSCYFLDAVDMMAPADTAVIVAFGDSITDGTNSTLNGDDRWPDVLSRRLHTLHGNGVSVVNAGIGGNQVAGPAEWSPQKPYRGGPPAGARLERDVLSLSGVTTVIWLEGINDFSRNGNATAEAVQAEMKQIVGRIRGRIPGVRVIGATVTSALGSTSEAHGFPEQDQKRKALNAFIRTSGVFDAVIDFDPATLDTKSGRLKPEFVHDTTTGGPGDGLHPNRGGYNAMGNAVDLGLVMPVR